MGFNTYVTPIWTKALPDLLRRQTPLGRADDRLCSRLVIVAGQPAKDAV